MPLDQLTAVPGTVALSTIFDALESVLSEPERAALMTQLVGLRPVGVAPGDLITAELFNAMLSDINDLKIRVAELEGGGSHVIKRPVITQVLKDPITTGEEQTVVGFNLDPDFITRIEVNGQIVTSDRIRRDLSGASRLVFPVPAIPTLPPTGDKVRLVIVNAAGPAEASFTQLPAKLADISANILAQLKSVTPPTPLATGQAFTLTYAVNIHSNQTTVLKVNPVAGGTGWKATMVGDSDIPVTAASSSGAGVTVTRTVQVLAGSDTNGSVALAFSTEDFPNFTQPGTMTLLTLGTVPQMQSDIVVYNTPMQVSPGLDKVRIANAALNFLKSGGVQEASIRINAIAKNAGEFSVAAAPDPNWTIKLTNPSDGKAAVTNANDVIQMFATISPKDAASPDGVLTFTVSRDGASTSFTLPLRMVAMLP